MADFNWPTACFLAPLDTVLKDPDALFRLVRPTEPTKLQKHGGVESALGLVNVIPQRRIYRMETPNEIEIFKQELLKRPLVLQCISHSGLGVGLETCGCAVFPVDVNWVLLINQTHPKVLGRLQMGIDAAKSAMDKGQSFILRYRFGTLLERLHRNLFGTDGFHEKLYHAEWEFAELIVRYPGNSGATSMNPVNLAIPTCSELTFDFADIGAHEVKLKDSNLAGAIGGPVPAITEDEIRELLPGWTVNEISPLDNIGEERPETYSYAQAGRLYESFRKKKRQRPSANQSAEPTAPPSRPNANISRRLPGRSPEDFDDVDINDVETSFIEDTGGFADAGRHRYMEDERNRAPQQPIKPPRKRDTYNQERRGDNSNSHFYPEITVQDTGRDRTVSDESRDYKLPTRGPGVAKPFGQVYHRNSDHSSDSTGASSATGADSGYCGDDGYGSYGNHRQDNRYNYEQHDGGRLHDHQNGSSPSRKAHENYGFYDDDDAVMQKHKQFVNQMMHQSQNYPGGDAIGDTKRQRSRSDFDDRYAPRPSDNSYQGQGRPRGYSDYSDLPSYKDVTREDAVRKFAIQEPEQMTESFI